MSDPVEYLNDLHSTEDKLRAENKRLEAEIERLQAELAVERERCARIAETIQPPDDDSSPWNYIQAIAAAIRDGKETQ